MAVTVAVRRVVSRIAASPKKSPGPKRCDDVVTVRDVDGARLDHEEEVARSPFGAEPVSRRHVPLGQLLGGSGELVLAELGEQRDFPDT